MLAAFTSGNAVLLWIVTFVAAEVRPSCIQCKKACDPFPPKPSGGASGSIMTTMKVAPVSCLSSAVVGGVRAPKWQEIRYLR